MSAGEDFERQALASYASCGPCRWTSGPLEREEAAAALEGHRSTIEHQLRSGELAERAARARHRRRDDHRGMDPGLFC